MSEDVFLKTTTKEGKRLYQKYYMREYRKKHPEHATREKIRRKEARRKARNYSRDVDLAWLAGLICGEGSIYRNKRSIRIIIVNTDKTLLDHAAEIIGKNNVAYELYASNHQVNRKTLYHLRVKGGNPIKIQLLKQILPYLVGIKCLTAKIAINYMESRLSHKTSSYISGYKHHNKHELKLLDQLSVLVHRGR